MQRDRLKFIPNIFLCAGVYLLFVALFSHTVADNDLWGYLSFGRIFWEEGYFPYHDIFSYTPTKSVWIYHEWLTGVSFYFIYKYAGMAGLQLLRYIIIVITISLLYETARKRGGTPLSACIALLPSILLISFGYVPVRAQIFTYLFFILTVYILESFKMNGGRAMLFWLLPIQILWCNFHGGFVAGLGLIGLYAVGEGLSGRKYIPIVIAGVLAASVTVINPYGSSYWMYTIDAITMPRPEIDEWRSVLSAIRQGMYGFPIFVFGVLSICCMAIYLYRRKREYTEILVIAVTIAIGVMHVRHSIFLGLIFGAYMPVIFAEHWKTVQEERPFVQIRSWLPGAAFCIQFLMIYLYINPFQALMLAPDFRIITPQSNFPVGAVKWMLQNNVKGNILSDFEWGEFLIWHCFPASLVAMDGRYETVYEDNVHKEYFDFLWGRHGWKDFLQKYPPEIILIKTNTRIYSLVQSNPEWRIAYMDHESALLVREKGRH